MVFGEDIGVEAAETKAFGDALGGVSALGTCCREARRIPGRTERCLTHGMAGVSFYILCLHFISAFRLLSGLYAKRLCLLTNVSAEIPALVLQDSVHF